MHSSKPLSASEILKNMPTEKSIDEIYLSCIDILTGIAGKQTQSRFSKDCLNGIGGALLRELC